ncbi:MAG TPA: acylphosphatase [Candidatus Moranbacteria bacterium]|nr:MAG: Acylphosphatase [Candidatus Moranbacteria bacterium GW2011_GWC2_45_10]KKT95547.1 MAG: Acylphosphatase [Parcubacteria group bacterium GW2011_GWC1_45_14]HAV11046.1 acylphosphatase [Candidatus Moranbacteria bacterium]
MKHLEIKIFGKVQGVFFRSSARQKAGELGLSGFAENLADGSVEIEAEGEEERLKEFLKWCHSGPERAEVEKVAFHFSDELKGFGGFEARR